MFSFFVERRAMDSATAFMLGVIGGIPIGFILKCMSDKLQFFRERS